MSVFSPNLQFQMLAQLHFVLFMILVFSSIFFIFFYSHFIFTLGFANWNSWHTFKRVHKCEMFVWGRVSIMNNTIFFWRLQIPISVAKKNAQKICKNKREINMYAKCIWYCHRTIVACTSSVRASVCPAKCLNVLWIYS